MEIKDAFTPANIQASGTVLEDSEEAEVREVLAQIYRLGREGQEANAQPQDTWEDVAVHAFMAGRTWQMEQDLEDDAHVMPVHMNLATATEFIEFQQSRQGR